VTNFGKPLKWRGASLRVPEVGGSVFRGLAPGAASENFFDIAREQWKEAPMSERPTGTVNVVDPSPLNWLYITYNTVEELIRTDKDGNNEPAAMSDFRWLDDKTLEVDVREGNVFPDGEELTAETVRRAFDEVQKWTSPHPPGTQFNLHPDTKLEVVDDHTARFHLPETDGLAVGKLRAMHLMNTRFWEGPSFGYERQGSGEGHW
jgi:ABC-type transport system substrate-binding protein